jgi:hypothetical protein
LTLPAAAFQITLLVQHIWMAVTIRIVETHQEGGLDMTFRNWGQKTIGSKIVTIIGFFLSVIIVILAALQIFNVYQTMNICVPLVGILMLLQAIENRKNKSVALVSLFAAVIIFVLTILNFSR